MIQDLAIRTAIRLADVTGTTGTTGGPGSGGSTPINTEEIQRKITETDLWKNVIGPVGVAIAIAVVIFGAFKIASKVASGNVTGVAKTAIGTLLVAAVLFRLDLLFLMISAAGTVVSAAVTAITDLLGG